MQIQAGSIAGTRPKSALVCAGAWLGLLALLWPSPAGANGFIQIQTGAVVLSPTIDDYANDYVEVTGPFGIRLRAKNTGQSGMTILVRCSDAVPQIEAGDLMLRTLTSPGTGGTTMAIYTAVTPVSQTLWSSGLPQGPFANIEVDVRIRNLFHYAADPFGTPTLTNTLVFTIVEP